MKAENSVERGTLPYRRFPDRPLQAFIDDVVNHIALTGQPETHPDLYRGRLSNDEPFQILKSIRVDCRLRPDGDLAPCPMCHSTNKFASGMLVYLFQLQSVAIIGNECASQSNRTEAHREFREREQRKNDEDLLLKIVPRLADWRKSITDALLPAEATGKLAQKFRTEGRIFFAPLRKVGMNGGQLSVTEVMQSSSVGPSGIRTSGGSGVQTRDHQVGTLSGLSLSQQVSILLDY